MKCNDCKWFVININDNYGVCKRYPTTTNKNTNDYCGEYVEKVKPTIVEEMAKPIRNVAIDSTEPAEFETPVKRGRKPKQ